MFQESHENGLWHTFLVTGLVQAPLSHFPYAPLSPKGFAGLAVVLPPAFLHVIFLTNSICWLHWYAGYTIRAHLGYQRLAITTDSYQPVDTTGYTGYSQCRREARGL